MCVYLTCIASRSRPAKADKEWTWGPTITLPQHSLLPVQGAEHCCVHTGSWGSQNSAVRQVSDRAQAGELQNRERAALRKSVMPQGWQGQMISATQEGTRTTAPSLPVGPPHWADGPETRHRAFWPWGADR